MGQSEVKEQTILELSYVIKDSLQAFQSVLDNNFARSPEVAKEAPTDRPQSSNVLDEIIENLKDNRNRLNSMINFIRNDIIPKIS